MKKKQISPTSGCKQPIAVVLASFVLMLLLQGCCGFYAGFVSGDYFNEACRSNYNAAVLEEKRLQDSLAQANSSSLTKVETATDSAVSVGNPIPQKNASGKIEAPSPGEYFTTTITAGPVLSFKSSEEEYSYGGSNHQPGIGAQIALSTAVPLSNKWGVAVALGFKQNNASETFDYSSPGTGSSESKDVYKYSYLGARKVAPK